MTPIDKAIRDKRRELADLYGSMVTLKEAGEIFGLKDHKSAKKALEEIGVEPVPVNGRPRYETGEIAKKIVLRRGMI